MSQDLSRECPSEHKDPIFSWFSPNAHGSDERPSTRDAPSADLRTHGPYRCNRQSPFAARRAYRSASSWWFAEPISRRREAAIEVAPTGAQRGRVQSVPECVRGQDRTQDEADWQIRQEETSTPKTLPALSAAKAKLDGGNPTPAYKKFDKPIPEHGYRRKGIR